MKDTSYRPLERTDQRKAAKDIPLALAGHNVRRIVQVAPGETIGEWIKPDSHVLVVETELRAMGVDGRTREARAKRATSPPPQAASTEGAGQ